MTVEDVKVYLRVTWDDENTNERIAGIFLRAKGILSSYAGVELEFDDTQRFECQLLLDLCRYINSDAFEDFKKNYASELISLRAKYAVAETEEENEEVSAV
jgi:hypothetical protein